MKIGLGEGRYLQTNNIEIQKFIIHEYQDGSLLIAPNSNNNTIKKDAIHISTRDKGEIHLDCKPC